MTRVLHEHTFDRVFKALTPSLTILRNGHHLRGKPPGIARSLQQRLAEERQPNEDEAFRVDIGLPPLQIDKSKQSKERLEFLKTKRSQRDLSKLDITPIDLEKTRNRWFSTTGPEHIKQILDHYEVYSHLFDRAYFYSRVPITASFNCGDTDRPVHFGNVIKPKDAEQRPQIKYECDKNTLWSLILTNLDGNFYDQNKEVLHWMVTNIPGNNIEKGELICNYLPPIPPKGTGYHRYVFVLYKQEKKLDEASLNKITGTNLKERSFSTLDFYRTRQDDITPAGTCFFQSDWDSSVHEYYHKVLEMKEPIYEYDFDPPHIKPEKWFPLREPFNLYLDKYRDPKEINKEFLARKLKNVHPFKPNPPPFPYPNAIPFTSYIPTWLKLEIRKSRLKWGRINDIE